MFEQLFEILRKSPVDLSSITAASGKTGEKQLLIAGDSKASVLSLLACVGADCPELASVQQPCVVECIPGSGESILLTGAEGTIRCTGLSDLGTRLSWPENRNATVQLTLEHPLFGLDRLVFAILDGTEYATQLSRPAAAARGAVIVLNAFEAPQKAVYDYAKWLAEAYGLSEAAAVVVQGHGDVTQTASAMMCALQMGVAALPTVTCDLNNGCGDVLGQVMEQLRLMENTDEKAQERAMAQRAQKLLLAEKERLMALPAAPARKQRSLAECFAAEIPAARMRIGQLFSDELSNQLYSEMRDFGIYLQQNITELLVSGVEELEAEGDRTIRTKEALRAFSQSYLDELLSGFTRQLISGLTQTELLPRTREIYDRMFRWAWIERTGSEAPSLRQMEVQELHTTVDKLQQRSNAILATLLTTVILFLCPELSRSNRLISAIHVVVELVVGEVREAVTSPRTLAKEKGKQLVEALDGILSQYQAMVTDTMIPQLRDALLGWFEEQTQLTLRELARCDNEQAERFRRQQQEAEANQAAIAAIDSLLLELVPWQA